MKKILLITALFTIGFSTVAQVNLSKSSKSSKEILNEQYASGLFKNAEGTIINVENEHVQGYLNILDWLNGRVAGLQIYITRSGKELSDDEVQTRIKVGTPVNVHFSRQGEDRVIKRVEIEDEDDD